VIVTVPGVQRQVYVAQRHIPAARAAIARYHRLLKLIDRLTAIGIELLKGGAFYE
jgi:hypothetical protein